MKKIGVILSGSGFMDGTEIREAVLTLLAIETEGAVPVIMAPDSPQHHTIDHATGNETKELRNVLEESARIARGEIQDINKVHIDDLDGVVLPGGFGAAKNLSNFAFNGAKGEVLAEVSDFLKRAMGHGKPIGAMCISPAVLSLIFGDKGVEVTIGNDPATAEQIELTGAKHVNKNVDEIHVDTNLKIVTTPAYMYGEAKLDKIYKGIHDCVKKVIELSA